MAILEVDHVTPRKHGGQDQLGNLVTACQDCNSGKSATLPEEWLREEVERAAREWKYGADSDEDDLSDMYAYQDALYYLEALPARDALSWMAKAYIAAMPYRPTHSEQILFAATMAKRAETGARVMP